MSQNTVIAKKYEACNHIERETPSDYVDEATMVTFTRETDVLPLFESKIYNHTRKMHYNINSNKLLQCRWKEYLSTIGGKQRTPVIFPNNSDFHFYKNQIKFEPSQSIASREHFRITMRPGPGVDVHGQIPIPNEMHLRRN